MVVKSKISGAMNDYLKTVSEISIEEYPETEIISFKSSAKNFVLDTEESLSSTSRSGLKKAERKFDVGEYSVRDTVTVTLEGRENNTRVNFSGLLGVAQYIKAFDLDEFEGMEGLAINHIDMTGNKKRRGFVNNRLYNLELCTDSQNTIHKYVVEKLQKIYPDRYFGVSAMDLELINAVRFKEDDEIKAYMDSVVDTAEVDKHGTIFIGMAGLKLRMWKRKWAVMKTEMELKKVRLS